MSEKVNFLEKWGVESPWQGEFSAIVKQAKVGVIFFDNAATTQKPNAVIRRMVELWENGVVALGRSGGDLVVAAETEYELAQKTVAAYFGARSEELVFCASATVALNMVAEIFTRDLATDEKILLSPINHHSNLAPWLVKAPGQILWLEADEKGEIMEKKLAAVLKREKVRVMALPLVSNVLGDKGNVEKILALINKENLRRRAAGEQREILICLDGAAAGLDERIRWSKLAATALVISGHKMYGPAIAGVIFKKEFLQAGASSGGGQLAPVFYGGGMLKSLSGQSEMELAGSLKQKWRAGVSDSVGVVGWAQACQWLEEEGEKKREYLQDLSDYLCLQLGKIPGIELLGGEKLLRGHLVSFIYRGFAGVDVMAYLQTKGIIARQGWHCAEPLHQLLQIEGGSVRISLAHYNSGEEIEQLIKLLGQIPQVIYSLDNNQDKNKPRI